MLMPNPSIALLTTAALFSLVLLAESSTDTNRVFSPCGDTSVQRSDGFTFSIAFAQRVAFFFNNTIQLSPCDRRLSLSSSSSQVAVFRPKVNEISLLTINTSNFFPCAPELSTHTGGSRSAIDTTSMLEKDLNRTPDWITTFIHMHTKGHDSQTWITEKARMVADLYQQLKVDLEAQGQILHPNEIFYEVDGGKNKQHNIYGLGNQAKVVIGVLSSANGQSS